MSFFSEFFTENRTELEAIKLELSEFEREVLREKNKKVSKTFSVNFEKLVALYSYESVGKALKALSRLLMFKIDKDQIIFFLSETLKNLSHTYCSALQYLSKKFQNKSLSIYKKIASILPKNEAVQLTLFSVEKYQKMIDKPVISKPKRAEVTIIGDQLSLL